MPSFPEVNTVEPSVNSKPSGKYSILGLLLPVPAKIPCIAVFSRTIGILLFKSFSNKTLDDR